MLYEVITAARDRHRRAGPVGERSEDPGGRHLAKALAAGEVGASAWWAAILLALVCTALAYILYFRLIAHVGPARAIAVTFLIPAFGMGWGVLFLDEPVGLRMLLGAGVILIGTALARNNFV